MLKLHLNWQIQLWPWWLSLMGEIISINVLHIVERKKKEEENWGEKTGAFIL